MTSAKTVLGVNAMTAEIKASELTTDVLDAAEARGVVRGMEQAVEIWNNVMRSYDAGKPISPLMRCFSEAIIRAAAAKARGGYDSIRQ